MRVCARLGQSGLVAEPRPREQRPGTAMGTAQRRCAAPMPGGRLRTQARRRNKSLFPPTVIAAAWAKIAQPRRYSGTRCSFRAANLAEQMVLWVTGGRRQAARPRSQRNGYAYVALFVTRLCFWALRKAVAKAFSVGLFGIKGRTMRQARHNSAFGPRRRPSPAHQHPAVTSPALGGEGRR